VHENRQVMRVRYPLEHREELWFIQRPTVDVGAELHATGAERGNGTIHLLQRSGDIVHWQRGDERGELLRPLRDHSRHAIVGEARQFWRKIWPTHQLWRGK
jgi:hypothetical protein